MQSKRGSGFADLTRFLEANRLHPGSSPGQAFRLKTLLIRPRGGSIAIVRTRDTSLP